MRQPEEEGLQLKEFSIALGQIAEEKGISEEKVLETVEAALSAAYKKDYGKRGQHIRAEFNQELGSAKFFLVKEVVDETTREFVIDEDVDENGELRIENGEVNAKEEDAEKGEKKEEKSSGTDESVVAESVVDEEDRLPRFNEERDITLEDALKEKKDAKVGDVIEYDLESHETFGRVAAQTAKQVIIQKIREAERESMYKEFKEKEGEVISGTVQRIEGRTVFIDLGKSTGVLLPSEQSSGDRYRTGQRFKVYVARVESDTRGPGVVLSRSHTELVRKLFELEVPEIFSGSVVIKAIARETGARTKIAVASDEEGIDPIGSCVGQKGTRVQAVIDELGGEKIDIIEWDERMDKFIRAAMSPAKVVSVTLNEEEKQANVIVPQDQLSLAIGRQGQNVRLASRLAGYRIDVRGEEDDSTNSEARSTDDGEKNMELDGEEQSMENGEVQELPVESGDELQEAEKIQNEGELNSEEQIENSEERIREESIKEESVEENEEEQEEDKIEKK